MVYPGGQISQSGMSLFSQDSVPRMTLACVASMKLASSAFLLQMDLKFITATLRGGSFWDGFVFSAA